MSTFLIYKSSAGSGKTTALVQFFLKLSLSNSNPTGFKKILAITFTNKAAAEMKERLLEELIKISDLDDQYDGGDFMVNSLLELVDQKTLVNRAKDMMQVILHDYNDLAIGTIDQFNHKLIRSFSRDLRLKSDFEVELDVANLFSEAVQKLLDKVGLDNYITAALLRYAEMRLDDEKRVNIAGDLEKLRNLVLGEDGLTALSAINAMDHEEFAEIGQNLRLKKRTAQEAIRKAGNELLEFIAANDLAEKDFVHKSSGVFGFIVKLKTFPEKAPIETTSPRVSDALEGKWLAAKVPAELAEKIASIDHILRENLQKCIGALEKYQEEYLLTKAILNQIDLVAVLGELSKCMDEICEERNVVPISKFNKIISEALRKEPVAFLYENYGNRFNHILIDEFQDTSELQWFNILPLIEESLAKGYENLVVGDAKQSIYRWRGGKAEQLIALPELLSPPADLRMGINETLSRTAEEHALSTNYRSKPGIIRFNNALFGAMGNLVTEKGSFYRKEYQKDALEQKIPKPGKEGFIRISHSDKKPLQANTEDLILQIERCISHGYSYGDMAILVRSTTKEGKRILFALNQANIPVSTASSFELDKNPKIKLVLSIMRLTIDPENIAAKIGAMRSLTELGNLPYQPLEFIKNKRIDFNKFLKQMGFAGIDSRHAAMSALELAQALMDTYYPHIAPVFSNGLLSHILDRVGTGGSVYEFFEWWDKLKEKPGVPGGSMDNSINLMTIHKSKGLQFKVVFVPQLDWKIRPMNNELKWMDIRAKQLRMPYAPLPLNKNLDSMGLSSAWKKDENETKFDNLNLIYVALTRAEEALFISYFNTDKNCVGHWIDSSLSVLKNTNPEVKDGKLFEEDMYSLEIGELMERTTAPEKKPEFKPVAWKIMPSENWQKRIIPVKTSLDGKTSEGVYFHDIVSRAKNFSEAERELERLLALGDLDIDSKNALEEMFLSLYQDERFNDLINSGELLVERELWTGSEILRPDLVIRQKGIITVLDFKTGAEKESHHKQLLSYINALREIEGKEIEGYLVYTAPLKWLKVQDIRTPTQGSLF